MPEATESVCIQGNEWISQENELTISRKQNLIEPQQKHKPSFAKSEKPQCHHPGGIHIINSLTV